MTSQRLDEALVARGLLATRARAKAAVEAGQVEVDGAPARKASQPITAQQVLTVAAEAGHYVSRAALKLKGALSQFRISAAGRHCLDLGASTGGFTQVLLEQGAAHVTGIDVGHGQMAPVLLDDPRVTLHEGVNARALTREHVPEGISLIVCDVSFISLKLALPPALDFVDAGTDLIALIKPQFEVGREGLGKGGVVRDESLLAPVVADITAFIAARGWTVKATAPSPITGGDGNAEFLLWAAKGSNDRMR